MSDDVRYETRKHVVDQAVVTYEMEISDGRSHGVALSRALAAGFASYENIVTKGIAELAFDMAEEIDADDNEELAYDGPAALLWLGREITESIPLDDRD